MKKVIWIVAVCLMGWSCRAGNHAPVQGAKTVAADADDFFPIMPWELPPHSVELFSDSGHGIGSLAECGFTVAGFVRPEHLAACEKYGLKAITCDAAGQTNWEKLSDAEIVTAVRKWIDESGNSPALMGYFLRDEPGVKEFAGLAKATALVKKLAPGKLAYINLYPDYATLGAPDLSQLGTASYTEYLERFVNEVRPQVVSYDNYQVQFSDDLKDAGRAASYYRNLLEIRRVAMEHGLPFWNIVSSNQIRPETTVPSPANLLFQAYTTLAAGGKGLTWYMYYVGGYHYAPIDTAGHRTAQWAYLKMVNEQVKVLGPVMKKLTSTGVYFSAPAPAANLPMLPGKLVEEVKCATPVMVGEFSGAGDAKYVMVVNLSLERSGKFVVKMKGKPGKILVVSPVDGTMAEMEADRAMWLTAGAGVLMKVE